MPRARSAGGSLGADVAAVRHPDSMKRFADLAAGPVGSSSAEQEAILRRQITQFRPVIQAMKLE